MSYWPTVTIGVAGILGTVVSGLGGVLLAHRLERSARVEQRSAAAEADRLSDTREAIETMVEIVETDWRRVAKGEARPLQDHERYARLYRRVRVRCEPGSALRNCVESQHELMEELTKRRRSVDSEGLTIEDGAKTASDLRKRMDLLHEATFRELDLFTWPHLRG